MFSKEQSVFVLVDVQGKLAHMVHESDKLINNLERLINGLRILKITKIWQYKYPQCLEPTTEKVEQHLSELDTISKITFDACKNDQFMQAIQATERKQMIVA